MTDTRDADTRARKRTPHRDSRGHYRALRVHPDSSSEEVQLSYEMLMELPDGERGASMEEIERAHGILMNAEARRAYDRVCTLPGGPEGGGRKGRPLLDDWRVLAASLILLFGILTFVGYPLYGNRIENFAPGDRLETSSGESFGVVVETSTMHTFPSGVAAEAYLIELTATGALRWYPADDIHATCDRTQ